MSTQRGIPCPVCDGEEETEYVALVPFTNEKGMIEPHRYAVGLNCYRKQWAVTYGKKEPCPV